MFMCDVDIQILSKSYLNNNFIIALKTKGFIENQFVNSL